MPASPTNATAAERMAQAEADSATRRRREVEALAATGRQAVASNSILISRLRDKSFNVKRKNHVHS